MRKTSLAAALAALLSVAAFPTEAAASHHGHRSWGADSFRLQLGEFDLDGDSSYWRDKEADFTGRADDFEDTFFGVSYMKPLGPRLGLKISGFFFETAEDQAYLDFEDDRGRDIVHTTELETAAITAGIMFRLAPPEAAVQPYVGVGGGLYSYRLTEFGDFIDFSGESLEIFDDFFEFEDEELGWYFEAGLEVPLAETWSIFAEARWDQAEADLSGDFRGLGDLDLSGQSYSAGIAFRF